MKKFLLLFLLCPLFLVAQESDSEIQETLNQNNNLVEQLAQLAPMSINPYTTVFLTSACSKAGFHNDFVATNPFFNNWFVLVISGLFFVFTALVGPIIKAAPGSPLGLTDDYLTNYAGFGINAFVMLAPTILSNNLAHNEIVYQAGFLSLSLKTILILFVSTYFLVVIMTVRFFIEILIFLSPIPLIDSILHIAKIVISIGFVLVSIISPITSLVIFAIMFLISLIFYRKSIRLLNRTKYLIIYPILNIFKKKETILTNDNSLSVLVYTKKKTKKFKRGKILRLEERDNIFFLVKNRFLMSKKEEEISLENCTLSQTHLDIILSNDSDTLSLLFNRSYHKFIDDLAKNLNVKIIKRAEIKLNLNKGVIYKIKNMFNKNDIAELNTLTE